MPDGQSHIKGWSHVVFCVANADVSAAFYREVLTFDVLFDLVLDGAELEAVSGLPGARGRIVAMQLDNSRIELLEFRQPECHPRVEPPSPSVGFVNVALEVDDLDSVVAGIKRRGIPYDGEAQTIQGVRIFVIRDPDGNRVQFIQYPSTGSAETSPLR